MRNLFFVIFILLISNLSVLAVTPQEALKFFNQYTTYANTYNTELLGLYEPNAKIIREVLKPTGEKVEIIVPSNRYFKELKIGQKTAKLKKYKNQYRNITAIEVKNGVKISAQRQPSKETYWLDMYQIIQDTNSGLKITEEMMQTKVQSFLKYKEKSE